MARKLNTISQLNKSSKLKLRKFIKTELGLAPNTKTSTLIKKTNVKTEKQLYKLIKGQYNEYIEEQNEIIEKERKSLKSFERNINKLIRKKENIKFENVNNVQRLKMILKALDKTGDRYIVKLESGKIYTLSYDLLDKVLNDEYDLAFGGSDAELVSEVNDFSSISVQKVKKKEKFKKGAFFKYEHKLSGLDLSELQIYEKFEASLYTENCFIKSLIGQVSDEVLNSCRVMCKGRNTTLVSIEKIVDKHDLTIRVKHSDTHINEYGKGSTIVNICLLDDHYFKLTEIPVTSYAIKNYFDIKDKEDWTRIYTCENGKYKKKNRFINSYNLVKLLLEHKDTLLTEITKCDELYKTCYFDDIKSIGNLEYNDYNVELNEYKVRDKKIVYTNVFFDFETRTSGEKHIPYLVCVKNEKINKTFYGVECGLYMLKYLYKYYNAEPIKLIAHNITYDLKFLFEYIFRGDFTQRGSMIMKGTGLFYNFSKKGQLLMFQDSYCLIPDKLSKFGKMFGLDQKKEFMPYAMYNDVEKYIDVDKVRKYTDLQVESQNIGDRIPESTYKEFYNKFIENATGWNCIKDGKIDIIRYSKKYCEIDCQILETGYNTFSKMINEVCDIDLEDYISIASIADVYMLKQGVFDGVYKLSGVVREFIQLCVVGGRTMCKNNEKHHIVGKVDDFDAVSLYPSAMYRLGGYLMGKPKVLQTTNYDIIKNYDGYYVECKITKLRKCRSFPLLSYIDDNGVRQFTNDMEGRTVYIDKISLEDAIEYHDIDFEIIRGYYYNEGRNYKLRETINYMFTQRKKLKDEGNPLQNIFKLLMNSAYGKTMLKPIEDETIYYYKKDHFNAGLLANYSFVKVAEQLIEGKVWYIKKIKSICEQNNNVSCGVEVLSMSKRIMNEVMCLAEDENLNIYYQDTDSMHIDSDNVSVLSEKYSEKYNRQLIGKQMGQFHTDFDSDILKGTIYAKESIFLGKKCYLDVLTDESGEIDYHIRMKGISSTSIKFHSQRDYNYDVLSLYKDLYNGKTYSFDLTCNGTKACFDMVDMRTVKTKSEFIRNIKFE